MQRSHLATIGMILLLGPATGLAGEILAVVKDQHGKLLADAVVVATPLDSRATLHARPPLDAVDQVDRQFVPFVKAVYVGTRVRFPNKDKIRHQVYSFSPAKKFELPLYAGSEAPPISFEKPGVVVLGCNIHDWMIGYIYVSDSPFFSTTEISGQATLSDLPRGEYSVRVWHPSMEKSEESTIARVTLGADGITRAEWQLAVKAAPRIPRVSGEDSAAY